MTAVNRLIAFGVSWERESLLARGLGQEHLRELLLRLARPLLRSGASLAYGGHWKEHDETNFTYELLRLISAEQEDVSASPGEVRKLGMLYNHSAWPYYLDISPAIEAQWMHCCRIVRITQEMAGIPPEDQIQPPITDAIKESARYQFNRALTLSAMRRLSMLPFRQTVPDVPNDAQEEIPAVEARILLGGRTSGYSGFLPGLFEEALVTLKHDKPLFILGGFGGAAEVLAQAVLNQDVPEELTLDWQSRNTPKLGELLDEAASFAWPSAQQRPGEALGELARRLAGTRGVAGNPLQNGLDGSENRELLTTADPQRAVQLVRMGLTELGLTSPFGGPTVR